MPSTLIFGGNGKVARHITRLLVADGHTVHSIIRNADQKANIESLGAQPIVQSIESSTVADLTQTIQTTQPSIVIFAAGAGAGSPERTRTVDHEGAVKCMDAVAAAATETKRYIVISALDVRDRERKPEPEWYDEGDRQRSAGVWKFIGPYMEAKLAADRSLVEENGRRGLEYTIVRPGGLSDETGKGKVEAGKVHLNAMVSREDVAAVVVEVMKNDGTKGLAFDVVGGETPIGDAVAAVARDKVDTFVGRY